MIAWYRVVFVFKICSFRKTKQNIRSLSKNNIHDVVSTLHCSSSISLTINKHTHLEELQETRFGGACLPYHCHCSAEVVHILTVGIQHHRL